MTNRNSTTRLSLRDLKNRMPSGMTISWKSDAEEYRVNFRNGTEATAYYTSDSADALATAKDMDAREHQLATFFPESN